MNNIDTCIAQDHFELIQSISGDPGIGTHGVLHAQLCIFFLAVFVVGQQLHSGPVA